jgi:GNAT superfamily N-acetyltransferase
MDEDRIESAAVLRLTELADLFTAGFAGYVIPFRMTPAALAERVAAEDVDLEASRVLRRGQEHVGLALVARRGWVSRVAAMGVRLEARGSGVGQALLARLLDDARARGDRRMRLEVFEKNSAARNLYEGSGFRTVTRLVGYEAKTLRPLVLQLEERDPAAFAGHLAAANPGRLPWQLEPASLAAPPSSARCFALEERAFVYLSSATDQAVAIRGVLTLPDHRRRGQATRLLRALAARHPGATLSFLPLFPEGLAAGFFEKAGFQRAALTQLEMARELP